MGRSPCCDSKSGLKKGPWTPEEDMKLVNYIQENGPGNWRTLPKNAGLQRCGKSCRLRWTNYLRPDIKRGRFSFEEEETIIQLHSVLGNKWSAIAARLPGRTDNEIKNYWNTHIRKRLLRMGIDPVTHAPRGLLDHLSSSSLFHHHLNSPAAHFSNLSNLLRLQQTLLLNPDALRVLALTLLSSSSSISSSSINNTNTNGQTPNDDDHLLLKKLREYQLLSNSLIGGLQDHHHIPSSSNTNTNTNTAAPTSSAATEGNSQSQSSSQGDQISMDAAVVTSTTAQMLQHNYLSGNDQHHLITSTVPPTNDPLYFWRGIPDLSSDTSSFQSISMNTSSQNYNNLESVMPTPLSSPGPVMNSSAAGLIPGSSENCIDEKENFCNNLLRFEIPEGFDFDDFM